MDYYCFSGESRLIPSFIKTYNGGNKVKKFKKILSSMLVLTLILSMTIVTGCNKKGAAASGKNSEKLTVTVGDVKVYLDEMMYYIFMNEYQLDQYDQMYQAYMGTSYWDMEYSEGVTMREFAKTSTMDMVIQYEILYAEAVKADYELTEEEKKAAASNVEQFMGAITKEQIEITGLTKEIALKVVEKLTLASRYTQDVVDGFAIDDEALKATLKKDDYRQYNTQALFITTNSVDEKGETKEITAKEKEAAKKKLEAVLSKAKAGDDFATIIEGNADITKQDNNFVVGDQKVSEEYEKIATAIKNEEVTDIVETTEGYYIIKMIDNNSEERYNTEVSTVISAEEEKQFQAEYEKIKKNYKTTINDEVWDTIVMGETTIIPAETETNTEAPAVDTSEDATDEKATDEKAEKATDENAEKEAGESKEETTEK